MHMAWSRLANRNRILAVRRQFFPTLIPVTNSALLAQEHQDPKDFQETLKDAQLRCQRICEQEKLGTVTDTELTTQFSAISFTEVLCGLHPWSVGITGTAQDLCTEAVIAVLWWINFVCAGECGMVLSNELYDVDLTFECPHCDHRLVRKGSRFALLSSYKCPGCGRNVRINYDDKVKLFDKHKYLAGPVSAKSSA